LKVYTIHLLGVFDRRNWKRCNQDYNEFFPYNKHEIDKQLYTVMILKLDKPTEWING
jgi:hypothetical protein